MYIDTDTGTILHGPIVWVEPHWLDDLEEDHTDLDVRVLADEQGVPVGRLIY